MPGQEAPQLARYDVGGTLAGPIRSDRTWFFYAVENLHETRGINLDLSKVPELISSGFVTPSFDGREPFDAKPVTRRFTMFGKLNHRINAAHQLFVSSSYNHQELDTLVRPPGLGFISPPTGSISLPSTASDAREYVFSVNGRETAFFGGDRWLLESWFRFLRGDFEENIDRGGGSTDEISTLTFAGGQRFWNTNFPLVGAQKTTDQRLEWGEDLSYYRGKHTAKFGLRLSRLSGDGFFRTPTLNIIGNTVLESRYRELGMDLTAQQSNRPLQPVNGREGYDINDSVFSLFAQDTWEVADGVTVNGGVRWDYETIFAGSSTNFGPRLGVTWDPGKDGKTVIRASAGRFYDAGLLGPALLAPDVGGATFSIFSFWSMPRGGAFFSNPGLNAFGPLQAGGTRFLANPTLFSYLMPAGQRLSSGGISITGLGRPYIVYELLGVPVPDPRNPPVLTAQSIPTLTGGRLSAQQADILNGFFPNPLGYAQFFYVPANYAGQVMREGTLAFKFRTEDVLKEEIQSFEEPFKTPYVDSFNIGVERQLFGIMSLDVQYFRRNGRRLLARRVANLRDQPVSSSCRGNTTDGQPCNRQLQPIGFSDVNAVTVSLRKHMSRRHSYLLSYTYTDATDNFNTLNSRGGGGNFNLNNQPELDIGRSLNTPEHVFVLSGLYRAGWGVDVSGVFRATSGRPFNAAGLPVDSDGDGNFDNRLLSTKKGEFVTDPFAQLDLRVAKTFGPPKAQFAILVEVFNLLNRRNPVQVNRAFGPTIGETIEPAPGREFQLGFRLDF